MMFASYYVDFGSFGSQSSNLYTKHLYYFPTNSSMQHGRFKSISYCISKLSNLISLSTHNLLLHPIQNCTLKYFKKYEYFSRTFLKSIPEMTYISYVKELIITFQESVILSRMILKYILNGFSILAHSVPRYIMIIIQKFQQLLHFSSIPSYHLIVLDTKHCILA